ncbi:MAG: UvrD-helicase domain-containing protein, partial [Armatimonadetes bacterium]|nr:UvrD-helicase domain-containing protein [Armatimonadota bacterium]
MVREARIRSLAAAFRERLGVPETASGAVVVAAALAHLGMTAVPLRPADPLLVGAVAVLDRSWHSIWHSTALAGPALVSVLAHEIGHAVLEPDGEAGDHSLADAPGWCDEPVELAYSPAQRGETEANLFAAELLAPRQSVRRIMLGDLTLQAAAEAWGVPERMVLSQCVAHAESPGIGPYATARGGAAHLDADQWAAVSSPSHRLMVHAGPGTGKTRCIIERVTYLLEHGAAPGRMLVLTFSNNAAEELIERLGARLGGNGRLVRVFTFHAFGLELLRTHHAAASLPASPRVLGTVDAIEMLLAHPDAFEAAMPAGRSEVARAHALLSTLNHLREAGVNVSGARLRAEAGEMPPEVAEAFTAWNCLLADTGAIDFAGMVTGAARLLLAEPSVGRAVGQSLDHVLIDEAQDISLMDAVMVRAISDHGASIWAVGDT